MTKKITVVDTTMRDGSHAVKHSFDERTVSEIAKALESSGVPIIEISHGDGLGGSSLTYGVSKVDEFKLISAAAKELKTSMLAVLLLPGIGTTDMLKKAQSLGASVVRVASHVTEADVTRQHITEAKKLGMFTSGFLMMAHMLEPEEIAKQAKLMESYGADYINLADSAGYLLPDGVKSRIEAVRRLVKIPVGFHAHNNLGMALGNSLAAIEAGATYIDATLRGLGAGAGNTQIEVLIAILNRMNISTEIDFLKLMDYGQEIIDPILQRPQTIDNGAIIMGYSGVYSSFLLHAYEAAKKYNLNPRDIIIEIGKRKIIGGQEDMILDVAYQLSKKN